MCAWLSRGVFRWRCWDGRWAAHFYTSKGFNIMNGMLGAAVRVHEVVLEVSTPLIKRCNDSQSEKNWRRSARVGFSEPHRTCFMAHTWRKVHKNRAQMYRVNMKDGFFSIKVIYCVEFFRVKEDDLCCFSVDWSFLLCRSMLFRIIDECFYRFSFHLIFG